ncbi:transposase, partial [Photobacterium sanctipauli]
MTDEFENISIIQLPPHSLDMNPIEQVWNLLRHHCLANQSFTEYNDLVSKVCMAWNQFL